MFPSFAANLNADRVAQRNACKRQAHKVLPVCEFPIRSRISRLTRSQIQANRMRERSDDLLNGHCIGTTGAAGVVSRDRAAARAKRKACDSGGRHSNEGRSLNDRDRVWQGNG